MAMVIYLWKFVRGGVKCMATLSSNFEWGRLFVSELISIAQR